MNIPFKVRVTRTRRSDQGFYLIVNGKRIFYKTKALAMQEAQAIVAMNRMQIITVRQFAKRESRRIQLRMPATPAVTTEAVTVSHWLADAKKNLATA